MPKTYTEAEVKALLDAQKASASTDLEEIAKRPYQKITAPDGQVLCHPAPDGPWTLDGQHPNDYYGAGDDGVATKGV